MCSRCVIWYIFSFFCNFQQSSQASIDAWLDIFGASWDNKATGFIVQQLKKYYFIGFFNFNNDVLFGNPPSKNCRLSNREFLVKIMQFITDSHLTYVKVILSHKNLLGLFLLCKYISIKIHLYVNEFYDNRHIYEF